MAVAVPLSASAFDTPTWSVYNQPSKAVPAITTKPQTARHPDPSSKTRPSSNLPNTTTTSEADALSRPLIAHSILQNHPHSQSTSPLLALPTEILVQITNHLTDRAPYFSISLALTCKRLGSLVTSPPSYAHILSSWRGFRDKESLYRLLTRPTRSSFSTQAINSPPFIPPRPTHILCPACYIHRTTSPSYWIGHISHQPAFDEDSVNWQDVVNFIDPASNRCAQQRCPDCVVAGYIAISRESEWKTYLRQRDEILSAGLDTLDGIRDALGLVRQVHPRLLGRMNQP